MLNRKNIATRSFGASGALLLGIFMATFILMTSAVRADSPSPLAAKMKVMATAMKNLGHPGVPPAAANPLDDLKLLKDAAVDCRDHSDDLAPAEVAAQPEALVAFKASFVTLLEKVESLEKALQLPADAPTRDAQIKAATAEINAVKKDGHSKFNP